ncbi:MAG: hypothetical protein ACJ79H_09845 [Myxococcales bacterium]
MKRLLPALFLSVACGAGLVDHGGVDLQTVGGLQCTPPQQDCGGSACVSTESDVNNCGACGLVCATPQHATSTCKGSGCGFTCHQGFFQCASQGCCPASALAAGGDTTCAVADGTVQCWGSNLSGQLGTSPASAPWSAKPVAVPDLPPAVSVSVGLAHACAILAGTGEVMCWGANESFQLGVGAGNGPVKVPSVSGAQSVALGDHHSCALTSAGAVCWGANESGQLADTTTSTGPHPAVPNTVGTTSLTAGSAFACAAVSGKLWCWGSNASGQILGASGPSSPTPVENRSVSNVSFTAAGSAHACAIGSGFWCWGSNAAGQLGDGSTSDGFKGVNLPTSPTLVAAGALHTCAVSGGAPFCWGANASGQLGSGTTIAANRPTQVALSGVQQLALGARHSCAQTADGAVYCWGKNDSGQAAAPVSAAVVTPRPID